MSAVFCYLFRVEKEPGKVSSVEVEFESAESITVENVRKQLAVPDSQVLQVQKDDIFVSVQEEEDLALLEDECLLRFVEPSALKKSDSAESSLASVSTVPSSSSFAPSFDIPLFERAHSHDGVTPRREDPLAAAPLQTTHSLPLLSSSSPLPSSSVPISIGTDSLPTSDASSQSLNSSYSEKVLMRHFRMYELQQQISTSTARPRSSTARTNRQSLMLAPEDTGIGSEGKRGRSVTTLPTPSQQGLPPPPPPAYDKPAPPPTPKPVPTLFARTVSQEKEGTPSSAPPPSGSVNASAAIAAVTLQHSVIRRLSSVKPPEVSVMAEKKIVPESPVGTPPRPLRPMKSPKKDAKGFIGSLSKLKNSLRTQETRKKKRETLREKKTGIFGTSLTAVVSTQKKQGSSKQDYPYFPVLLCDCMRRAGYMQEGLFRTMGNAVEMRRARDAAEAGNYEEVRDVKNVHSLAGLFIQWMNELPEPIIPSDVYDDCIDAVDDPELCIRVVEELLPEPNKETLKQLIKFFQEITDPSVIKTTQLGISNLAVLFYAVFLWAPSDTDLNSQAAMAHTEQDFLRQLITHMELGVRKRVAAPPPLPEPF